MNVVAGSLIFLGAIGVLWELALLLVLWKRGMIEYPYGDERYLKRGWIYWRSLITRICSPVAFIVIGSIGFDAPWALVILAAFALLWVIMDVSAIRTVMRAERALERLNSRALHMMNHSV